MQEPNRPAITQATIVAAVIALIAPVAEFLRAFGVYDLNAGQQHAIGALVLPLAVFGGLIAAADAYLRGKRNEAHAATMLKARPVAWPVPSPQPKAETLTGVGIRAEVTEAPRPAVDIETGDPPPLNVPGRKPT